MKQSLSERDICTKYITPAVQSAGWDLHTQIREEVSFTAGRIIVRGKLHSRGKAKRADYVLYHKPNQPIAVIEAKDNSHSVGHGMQQTLDYAETREALKRELMSALGGIMGEVVIYRTEDGGTSLKVHLQGETLWLTQVQLAELFDVKVPAISKHVSNILKSGELDPASTVSKMEKVQVEGGRKVKRKQSSYNLDMVISIGYRVNSTKATKFRVWATQILRDHLVRGYTINEQRLREETAKFKEMQQTVQLLTRTLAGKDLVNDTGRDVLQVINDYAYALATLDHYDHGSLKVEATSGPASFVLQYEEAISVVQSMKDDFEGLFGLEKDQGFKSALGAICQTFDGKDVYPSIEEKGANLLYFIVKNHAFTDGNKRIAAAIFIYFLSANGILYRSDGSKRLADNALVALTLLIAESRPEEKEIIVKVIVNLINRSND